ncbi:MAG: nuclear transport factor 2 family protein [Pseudomonadota bacterium]|nr:nuclear transport factor 2 family protein [Pseudomonadota bacterium]
MALLVGALASCQQSPPEQRLREAVGELQLAVEGRDAGAIEDRLASDFIGPGALDRAGARRIAQAMFLRHRDVGVVLGPLEVQIQQEHATVEFTAALTGGRGGLLPESGRIYDVRTGWRLRDNEWQLTSAEWSSSGE